MLDTAALTYLGLSEGALTRTISHVRIHPARGFIVMKGSRGVLRHDVACLSEHTYPYIYTLDIYTNIHIHTHIYIHTYIYIYNMTIVVNNLETSGLI